MTSQRKRAQNSLGGRLNKLASDVASATTAPTPPVTNSVTTAAIAPNAVTSDSLAPDSVDSDALGRGAVGTENLGVINEIDSDSVLQLNAPIAIALGGAAYPLPTTPSPLVLDVTGNVVLSQAPMPIGAVIPYIMPAAPQGWLICDGSAISRTGYAALFSLIGVTFGSGDGTTTFNLPDMSGRVAVGLSTSDSDFGAVGDIGGAKVSTHSHNLSPAAWANISVGGAGVIAQRINVSTYTPSVQSSGSIATNTTNQTTGTSLGGVTDGTTESIVQPYMALNYILKAY